MFLERVNEPADLRDMSNDELDALAAERGCTWELLAVSLDAGTIIAPASVA